MYVSTLGYGVSKRCFDFEELPPDTQPSIAGKEINRTKVAITVGVFALAIVLFVTELLPFGATALMCACILILTGCVPVNVVNNISWDQIFVIVGSIGLGAGVTASGAGTVLANLLIKVCGSLGNSPYFMVCFVLLLATVLSNFMSNNAAVTIICPIAFAIGRRLGCDLLPFALAVGVGSNLSESTPISCANITLHRCGLSLQGLRALRRYTQPHKLRCLLHHDVYRIFQIMQQKAKKLRFVSNRNFFISFQTCARGAAR